MSQDYSIEFLSELTESEFIKKSVTHVDNVASLNAANSNEISFYMNKKYKHSLLSSNAGIIILRAEDQHLLQNKNTTLLISSNPYLAYAKISKLFNTKLGNEIDYDSHDGNFYGKDTVISKNASIGKNVIIGDNVKIYPGVVIGNNVQIGSNSLLMPNTIVYDNVKIGTNNVLHAKSCLYYKVSIGNNCIIHAGAVIGSDGFGFAFDKVQLNWQKIEQLGGVFIGNDVEIGSNTTIDCGTFCDTSTVIEDGVKLDNCIQIGHNVRIGKFSLIAGCTAIAGSTQIGAFCVIGGGVLIAGHLQIADRMQIAGGATVHSSLLDSGNTYASGMPVMPIARWKRLTVRLKNLEKLFAYFNKHADR